MYPIEFLDLVTNLVLNIQRKSAGIPSLQGVGGIAARRFSY
ncbi:hypothetical protein NIES3585_49080 [Nodularia sp. NIES-3585]|nr:hypothetical protein NIES3585_49080 [Nodularia sp. NIES-3585]